MYFIQYSIISSKSKTLCFVHVFDHRYNYIERFLSDIEFVPLLNVSNNPCFTMYKKSYIPNFLKIVIKWTLMVSF